MKYVIIICLFFQVFSIAAVGQEYKYHTVSPGETVFSISQKYNVSKEVIYKYNPDAIKGIQISSRLVIPISKEEQTKGDDAAVSFRTHKVEKKETLYSLAQEYGVEIEDIKKYNKQLYSKELQKGEIIQIPVFVKITESKPASSPSKNTSQGPQLSKTREHIILPKETKFGIARKYGMTVAELEALNPTVSELQPGIMLRVGTDVLDEPVIIINEAFRFYEVQPKETLYSLTKRFQVETDSLMALNPALKDGLKSGMVLKVPTKDARGRELKEEKEKREESIVLSGERSSVNLERNISNYDTKNVVLMLPYNLSKIKVDSTSNAAEMLMKDRVMRISLDFYNGALMAVERAKQLGISTNLKVYDTQQQAHVVASTISSNNFDNVDVVIGPLLQATSEEAASRLINKNIPVISPMTNRELRSLPNLYQARPSDDMMREAMINYLAEKSYGKNIVIIADASSGNIKNKLLNALPNSKTVNPSGNNISEASINAALVEGKENWVILESESVALLSSATSTLNRLARSKMITLFTTNKNNSFESDVLSNEHLGRLKFHFPSEYKEFNEVDKNSFIDAYKTKYGFIPNKYTVRGYDLTLDVLLRLGAMGSLEKSVQANILTEYVENKFGYKPKPSGGFYNDAVYIMQFNPDLTLSIAK